MGFEGQEFGNYRAERLLGQGSFALVYAGRHSNYSDDVVAIKILRDPVAAETKQVFEGEARALRRLNHQGIIRLRDYGTQPAHGYFYLTMDYAPNGTLEQKHPMGTRLQLPLIVSYVKQAAAALLHAHQEDVIHCDIKPVNMLLGRKNEIVLGDFGVARIAQDIRALRTGTPIGTIAFMSPEQIIGKPCYASDQYSLAVVVYLWLSGTLPFFGVPGMILMQHRQEQPPSLCAKVPGLPRAVEQVVLRAMSKESKDRYEDIQAFATALEQASQPGRPISFPVAQPKPQPVKPVVQPRMVQRARVSSAAEEWYKKGNEYWFKKRYDDAIRAYDTAISLAPKYIEAYLNRGRAKNDKFRFSEAIQDFDKVIQLDPEYYWAYSHRGFAHLGLKEYEQAIKDYDQAIACNPNLQDSRTFLHRGLAHELQGKGGPGRDKIGHFVQAIENYDSALRWNARNEHARRNRSELYRLLNSG